MCASYWNLDTKIKCPNCCKVGKWNLQTHFMGDFGSCINFYKLGQTIPELKGITVTLDGKIDDFIGDCPSCDKLFDLGGAIVDGRVEKVYIMQEVQPITDFT